MGSYCCKNFWWDVLLLVFVFSDMSFSLTLNAYKSTILLHRLEHFLASSIFYFTLSSFNFGEYQWKIGLFSFPGPVWVCTDCSCWGGECHSQSSAPVKPVSSRALMNGPQRLDPRAWLVTYLSLSVYWQTTALIGVTETEDFSKELICFDSWHGCVQGPSGERSNEN